MKNWTGAPPRRSNDRCEGPRFSHGIVSWRNGVTYGSEIDPSPRIQEVVARKEKERVKR